MVKQQSAYHRHGAQVDVIQQSAYNRHSAQIDGMLIVD
jgi:hypothetical protein